MKSPFARLLAASFFIPIGLLVLNTLHANQLATLSIDRYFFMNWLYMAAPQLILGVSTFVLPSLLGGGIVTDPAQENRCRDPDILISLNEVRGVQSLA
jgi:hypothetical protein